jgi:hypothetical protein
MRRYSRFAALGLALFVVPALGAVPFVFSPSPPPAPRADEAALPRPDLLERLAALDPQELKCLALNVYQEARGESPEGQLAVAHVTLNRARDPAFPSTICGVVYQPGAFSWTADPQKRSTERREPEAWRLATLVAEMAMLEMTEDPTGGATDFHATYVQPWWTADKSLLEKTGNHKFYSRVDADLSPRAKPRLFRFAAFTRRLPKPPPEDPLASSMSEGVEMGRLRDARENDARREVIRHLGDLREHG